MGCLHQRILYLPSLWLLNFILFAWSSSYNLPSQCWNPSRIHLKSPYSISLYLVLNSLFHLLILDTIWWSSCPWSYTNIPLLHSCCSTTNLALFECLPSNSRIKCSKSKYFFLIENFSFLCLSSSTECHYQYLIPLCLKPVKSLLILLFLQTLFSIFNFQSP